MCVFIFTRCELSNSITAFTQPECCGQREWGRWVSVFWNAREGVGEWKGFTPRGTHAFNPRVSTVCVCNIFSVYQLLSDCRRVGCLTRKIADRWLFSAASCKNVNAAIKSNRRASSESAVAHTDLLGYSNAYMRSTPVLQFTCNTKSLCRFHWTDQGGVTRNSWWIYIQWILEWNDIIVCHLSPLNFNKI